MHVRWENQARYAVHLFLEKMPRKTGNEFKWTDDEAELLLTVANEYKVQKSSESVDWESVKSKYDDILVLMQEALPSSPEEARESGKDYPHERSAITKQILSTKLKNIRLKYRHAVDSGRRSGHGRVVLLYYELCERIWGGSPATDQIEGGLETGDIDPTSSESVIEQSPESPVSQGESCGSNSSDPKEPESLACHDDSEESTATTPASVPQSAVGHRRKLLDAKLSNFKQEKLKRKLPVDSQLLSCAQEELRIKRKLVDQMDRMEKQYSKNMSRLSTNMEKLTNSIANGFSILQNLVGLQSMYPHPQPSQVYPFQPSMPSPGPYGAFNPSAFDPSSAEDGYGQD